MKKINLYLVRARYYDGNGHFDLVMTDENENIYEAIAKKHNIEAREDLGLSLSTMVNVNFDIVEVDCDRLAQLLG